MSCRDKAGGTHHNACECREAYIRRLEAVVAAAREVLADECDGLMFDRNCHCHGPAKVLRKAMDALEKEAL